MRRAGRGRGRGSGGGRGEGKPGAGEPRAPPLTKAAKAAPALASPGMAELWERLGKPRREVRPFNLLLAVTGSVAAIKVEELVAKIRQVQDEVLDSAMDKCECGTADTTEGEDGKGEVSGLKEEGEAWKFTSSIEVKVVATDAGRKFLPEPGSAGSKALDTATQLFDEDEWRSWREKGDPVLHIDLRKWADMMLVAPLSANTLAKVANGMCDNLVTCVVRAWSYIGAPDNLLKPLVVAPAMSPGMWEHPITKKQLKALDDLGVSSGCSAARVQRLTHPWVGMDRPPG